MKMRSGQVAIYLMLVIFGIVLLVLMNVGTFVTVRAKNRTMNAGDAAALAVANVQADCLNQIGDLNAKHLRLALKTRSDADPAEIEKALAECAEMTLRQRRICLLGPLDGIRAGNKAAQEAGGQANDGMRSILTRHLNEDLPRYQNNVDLYPPSWTAEEDPAGESAWDAYRRVLANMLGEPMYAGPDNVEYVDAAGGHVLLSKSFYNAVAGRAWCWFKFNAPGLLDSYSDFHDWGPLPSETAPDKRRNRCVNSEVYSLHLVARVGNIVELLGEETVMDLAGCSHAEIRKSAILSREDQTWFFYDTEGAWRQWSTYPDIRFNPNDFPIASAVRSEYDVMGAAAICRTIEHVKNVDTLTSVGNADGAEESREYRTDWRRIAAVTEEPIQELGENPSNVVSSAAGDQTISWAAGAKPFGTVTYGGAQSDVTAFNGFVTHAYLTPCAHLVPIDSVGGRDLSTADFDWSVHVRDHLPSYQTYGPTVLPNWCYCCNQLRTWERASVRRDGRRYLKYHGDECERTTGPGNMNTGGTPHGH